MQRFLRLALLGLLAQFAVVGWFAERVVGQQVEELAAVRVIGFRASPADDQKAPVVSAVALSPQGAVLAAAGDDHTVRLWDGQSGRLLGTLRGHTDWVHAVAFDPAGRWLVTAGQDRTVCLWSLSDRRLIDRLLHTGSAVASVVFAADGQLLAAATFAGKVYLLNVEQPEATIRQLSGPGPDIRSLAFSPAGDLLAAGGRNGTVRIWRMQTATEYVDLPGHRRRVRALAFDPAGRLLASAGEDRCVIVWDVASGRRMAVLGNCPAKLMSLAFCGAQRVAAGGSDNVIRIWDLRTGRQTARLTGHTGSISTLVWDPHGKQLISGSFDTTIRTWNLGSQEVAVAVP